MLDPDKIHGAVTSLKKDLKFDEVFLATGGMVVADDYLPATWNNITMEHTVFQKVLGTRVTFSSLKDRGLLAESARIIYAGGERARDLPEIIEAPDISRKKELLDYLTLQNMPAGKYNPFNALGGSKFFGALWSMKLAAIEAGKFEVI